MSKKEESGTRPKLSVVRNWKYMHADNSWPIYPISLLGFNPQDASLPEKRKPNMHCQQQHTFFVSLLACFVAALTSDFFFSGTRVFYEVRSGTMYIME